MDIDIRRVKLALRLSGDAQRLEPVGRRLDGLLKQRLQPALRRWAVAPSGLGDEEIVFIDGMHLHCGANTAWDDEAIVQQLARRLALALQARLADPGLLRFRDRPDFVAAALLAVAEGQAQRCWWFAEFDGLQHLDTSAALRTLVINEGEAGLAALARLTNAALARVLAHLQAGDSARLLAWLEQRSASAPLPLMLLWAAAQSLPATPADAPWLRGLVEAERAQPGSAGREALSALRSLAALHRAACAAALAPTANGVPPTLQPRAWLRQQLAALRLGEAVLASANDAELADLVRELCAQAQSAQTANKSGDAPAPATWFDTRHGGFFVLLARLQRLGWLVQWQALLNDENLCRALACQVAALALAGPAVARVLRDGTLQSACGLEPAEGSVPQEIRAGQLPLFAALGRQPGRATAALRAVLREHAEPPRMPPFLPPAVQAATRMPRALPRLLAEAAALLMADTARALPGLDGSTPDFLRTQALALPAAVCPGGDHVPTLVRLGRAPLNVLLVLAGVKRSRIEMPGVPPIQCAEDLGT